MAKVSPIGKKFYKTNPVTGATRSDNVKPNPVKGSKYDPTQKKKVSPKSKKFYKTNPVTGETRESNTPKKQGVYPKPWIPAEQVFATPEKPYRPYSVEPVAPRSKDILPPRVGNVAVSKNTKVKRLGVEIPLKHGDEIRQGDVVVTGKNGRAIIKYSGISELTGIGPNENYGVDIRRGIAQEKAKESPIVPVKSPKRYPTLEKIEPYLEPWEKSATSVGKQLLEFGETLPTEVVVLPKRAKETYEKITGKREWGTSDIDLGLKSRGFMEALEERKPWLEIKDPIQMVQEGQIKGPWVVPAVVTAIFFPDPTDVLFIGKFANKAVGLAGKHGDDVLFKSVVRLNDEMKAGRVARKTVDDIMGRIETKLADESVSPEMLKDYQDIYKQAYGMMARIDKKAASEAAKLSAEQKVLRKTIKVEGFHTTGTEQAYSQRGAGTYIALDEPFRGAGKAEKVNRATTYIEPEKIFDPNGIVPGSNKTKSIEDSKKLVNELNKNVSSMSGKDPMEIMRKISEARTDTLRKMGYDGEAGFIDAPGGNRELIIFDNKKVKLTDTKPAKAAPPAEPPRAAHVPTTPVNRYLISNARPGSNMEIDAYGIGSEFEVPIPKGEMVTVYRAVPSEVNEIKPGDYVTASRRYAEEHLGNHLSGYYVENPALMKGGKILEIDIPKSELELYTANEFKWVGKGKVPTTPVAPVAGDIKPVAKLTPEAREEAIDSALHLSKALPERADIPVNIEPEKLIKDFEETAPLVRGWSPDKRTVGRMITESWFKGTGPSINWKAGLINERDRFTHNFLSRWVYIQTAGRKYGVDQATARKLYENKKLLSDVRKRHLVSVTEGMPLFERSYDGKIILDEAGRPRILDPWEHGLDRSYTIQNVLSPMDALSKQELYATGYKGERQHLLEVIDDYLYAKHAESVINRGINPGTSRELIKARMDAFNALTGSQRVAADAVFERAQHTAGYVREYMYSMGVINKATKDLWEETSPFYIPLNRLFEEGLSDADVRSIESLMSRGPQAKMLKPLYGSDKPTITPLRSIFDNAILGGMYADKMAFQAKVVDFFEQTGAVRRIQTTKPIANAEEKAGRLLDTPFIEQMVTETGLTKDEVLDLMKGSIYANLRRPENFKPETMIWILRDGKKELWEFSDKMLLESVRNDDPMTFHFTIRALQGLSKLWKTTVTMSIDFMTGNLIRDAGNRMALYNPGKGPGKFLRNIGDALMAPATIPVRQLYAGTERGMESEFGKFLTSLRWAGYGGSSLYADFQKDMNKYIRKHGRVPKFTSIKQAVAQPFTKEGLVNNISKPFEYMEKVGWMLDQPQRISAALDTYRKTGDIYKAAIIARDVSTDFAEQGKAIKFVSGVFPFGSASIGGLRTAIKMARENPTGFLMRGLVTYAIPSMMLESMYRDEEWYQDLPKQMKGQYFVLGHSFDKNGQEWIYTLPKPWEIGAIFSTLPSILARESLDGKPVDKKELWAELENLFVMSVPKLQNPLTSLYFDIRRNYDPFFDRTIESEWDVARKIDKSLRDNPNTLEAFRTATAKGTTLNKLNVSPAQLEHVVRKLFGTWGKYGIQGLDYYQASKDDRTLLPKVPEWADLGNFLLNMPAQMVLSRIVKQGNMINTEPVSNYWDFYVGGMSATNTESDIRSKVKKAGEVAGLTEEQIDKNIREEIKPYKKEADYAYFIKDYVDDSGIHDNIKWLNNEYKLANSDDGEYKNKSIPERIETKAKAARDATIMARIVLDEYLLYEKNPTEYRLEHPIEDPDSYFNYIQGKFRSMKTQ